MNKEELVNVLSALFQIHAFAKLLENDAEINRSAPSERNGISNEQMSLAQVIAEKAEFCLAAIEKVGVQA